MARSSDSVEERLKELKEAYAKLFNKDDHSQFLNPPVNYLTHYRNVYPNQLGKYTQEERKHNEESIGKSHSSNERFGQKQPGGLSKLKLRPLLEDLTKRGAIEKRNFMLQRMDDLSASRPARVMDYVRKQYPITLSEDTTSNTFFILGDVHRCIREYLTSNGWIEKYSGHEERIQMIRSLQGLPSNDHRTLGRMLAADPVKFIWVNGFINWSLINNNIIVSRIPSSSYYFSKTALASSIRDLFPFLYVRGTVDVLTPRTFELRMPEDMRHFVKQYRISACISLLKRFVSFGRVETQLAEDGTVPLDCVDFAVQRLVEHIRFHQNADLDEWHFSVVSDEDWSVFLYRFQDLINQDAKFQTKNHSINIPKLVHTCEKLCLMYEKCIPDTKHDGFRNLWIVKPANGSCGRGVRIFKGLREIQQYCKPTNSYVVQKYIENPLLIYHTKFDIRQWFLITSVYPLVIWMYNECYLRFCSQQFSLVNVHESVHLCNNSIQYKYRNGSRSPQLPEDNMWDDKTFQNYLSEHSCGDAWPDIKKKMQQAIVASCLVSQDKMYHRTNSFHLYGADFMITPDYNVWLIEINTHPSMKYSTSVTTRMCKEVLQDTLKVGLDRRSNPHADTGKFVEIYRQPTHMPSVGVPASAAGVQARKIRLVSQPMSKESSPLKLFEEVSKAQSKIGKWLTYTNVATYKKHNKITFKYVVLRHTDMPLDPGDSITQRDIGYAGVLDKTFLNENNSGGLDEVYLSEGEAGDKDKKQTAVPKAVNQMSLHRKVIAKLKTNEKTSSGEGTLEDTKEDKEINPNKSIGILKNQSVTKTQNTIQQLSGEPKQTEVPFPSTDAKSKPLNSEVVQEIRTVSKTGGEWILTSEKPESTDTSGKQSYILKKVVNAVGGASPKQHPVKPKATKSVKPGNARKSGNLEHGLSPENVDKTEKILNLNQKENKGKVVNAQRKVLESVNVVNTSGKGKDPKPFERSDNKKTIVGKSSNEQKSKTSVLQGSTRKLPVDPRKNISKESHAKQNVRLIKKTSSAFEKIVSDKLGSESINFIKISRLERDNNANKNESQTVNKTKRNKRKKPIPKKTSSNQLLNKAKLQRISSNSFISRSIFSAINKSRMKGLAKKESVTALLTDSIKPNKQTDNQASPLKGSKQGTSRQKTIPIEASSGTVSTVDSRSGRNPSDDFWAPEETDPYSFRDRKDRDDIILQQAFIPQQLIFMISDSETSFKTAANAAYDEALSDEGSVASRDQSSFDSDYESENSEPKSLADVGTLKSSSIKRYNNRNKYRE